MYYMLFVYDVYYLFGLCFMLFYIFSEVCFIIFRTRRSGRYAPILLAPAEGCGALQAPRALRALLGAFGPSSVGERSKQNILNLVSK